MSMWNEDECELISAIEQILIKRWRPLDYNEAQSNAVGVLNEIDMLVFNYYHVPGTSLTAKK